MAQVIYMHGVMNSDNVLSLPSVLLLGIIVVVTTLAIGGQMAKSWIS
ncbi:MAG TPA: hypothetical protein VE223_07675 [Nitrososphaeraceae archaeon]|nr:hypothetical protein [Nitrososphaeraceae archaeon]